MYSKIRAALLAVFLLGFMIQSASALNIKLEAVATALRSPIDLKSPPDGSGRRFIVEQLGTIRILMPDGKMLSAPFLNIRGKLVDFVLPFDERGLLGLAFHPKYKSNGKFYVHYSAPTRKDAPSLRAFLYGNHTSTVSEFKVSKDPNIADPDSERVLLQLDQPYFNHNGGALAFRPKDGYLYISFGDGGFADDWGWGHDKKRGNGQVLTTLLGKILRIDVNKKDKGLQYGIPADNPFVGKKGAPPEIFAYGFRNPWRMTFDMGGNRSLFVADVQQNSYEEVHIVTKGGNYGWRVKEGTHCFDYLNPNDHKSSCADSGMIDPIIEYNNCKKFPKNCDGSAVMGGAVYRGKHRPWQGKYFFGDWSMTFRAKNGRLYVATESGGKWRMERANVTNMDFQTHVLAISNDGEGNVYVLTSESGGPNETFDTVYQILP